MTVVIILNSLSLCVAPFHFPSNGRLCAIPKSHYRRRRHIEMVEEFWAGRRKGRQWHQRNGYGIYLGKPTNGVLTHSMCRKPCATFIPYWTN